MWIVPQRNFFRDSWNIPHFKRQKCQANKTQTVHIQLLASKETNKLVKSGQSPTTLSNKVPHSNTKHTGLFQRQSPKQRRNKVSGWTHQSDLPHSVESISSQMSISCSNWQALRRAVPLWGILKGRSSGRVVPATAGASFENSTGAGWLWAASLPDGSSKLVTKSKLLLLTAWQNGWVVGARDTNFIQKARRPRKQQSSFRLPLYSQGRK